MAIRNLVWERRASDPGQLFTTFLFHRDFNSRLSRDEGIFGNFWYNPTRKKVWADIIRTTLMYLVQFYDTFDSYTLLRCSVARGILYMSTGMEHFVRIRAHAL